MIDTVLALRSLHLGCWVCGGEQPRGWALRRYFLNQALKKEKPGAVTPDNSLDLNDKIEMHICFFSAVKAYQHLKIYIYKIGKKQVYSCPYGKNTITNK